MQNLILKPGSGDFSYKFNGNHAVPKKLRFFPDRRLSVLSNAGKRMDGRPYRPVFDKTVLHSGFVMIMIFPLCKDMVKNRFGKNSL